MDLRHPDPRLDGLLQDAVREGEARFFGAGLLGLALGGSLVRGQAKPTSDLDFFGLVDNEDGLDLAVPFLRWLTDPMFVRRPVYLAGLCY